MNFIDYVWQPYNSLNKNELQQQIRNQIETGYNCCDCELEFMFVPIKRLETLSNLINETYNKLNIIPTETTICDEVFYTSKIEGANITIQRTHELITNPNEKPINFSENMVLGAYNATKFLNLHPGKISVDLILNTWSILVEGACSNIDIRGDRFRTGGVQVGNHIGLHMDYIESAIETWVDYYNSDTLNNYPFIKAAILHYIFEYIHPFCDGNGRLGRLLMLNYLINNGYDKFKAIALSPYIDKDRISYDYSFNIAENVYSDITPFITYILSIFKQAVDNCLSLEVKLKEYYASKGLDYNTQVKHDAALISTSKSLCVRHNIDPKDKVVCAYLALRLKGEL